MDTDSDRAHHVPAPVQGTVADDDDMRRMGRVQELNRIFGVVSIIGYAVLSGLTWPFAMATGASSISNGGPAGNVWVFLGVCFTFFTVVLSMAEMASIEPTAAGQYGWVSAFAPEKWRRELSYAVGWMCALGWQSFIPGSANVGATTLQALGVVASDTYVPTAYQTVLLTILMCCLAPIFNVTLAKRLPGIESAVSLFYVLLFIVILVVLAVMGPRSSASEVFTDFRNDNGWNSIGTACFVTINGPVITLIGSDCAVHLAEEMRDSSRNLPRAMLGYATVNYVIGFAMLLTTVFVIGDIDSVTNTATGQPYIQVIWNATRSRGATIFFAAMIAFLFFFSSVNTNTTSSRQLYAFARDGGLPCSKWICRVSPNRHVPLNAVILTLFLGCCIATIPLGSTTAFFSIQTTGNAGLLTSYIICICTRLYNRNYSPLYGKLREPPPFYLGKTGGNIVNAIAVASLVVFLVATCFPLAPSPTPDTMNWSSITLGATVLIAAGAWIWLHKTYLRQMGPVSSTEEIDIDQYRDHNHGHVYISEDQNEKKI